MEDGQDELVALRDDPADQQRGQALNHGTGEKDEKAESGRERPFHLDVYLEAPQAAEHERENADEHEQ